MRDLSCLRIPRGRCEKTGKLRFDHNTAQGALRDAKRRHSKGNPFRRECRIYKCPECGDWHLTSAEKPPPRVAS